MPKTKLEMSVIANWCFGAVIFLGGYIWSQEKQDVDTLKKDQVEIRIEQSAIKATQKQILETLQRIEDKLDK